MPKPKPKPKPKPEAAPRPFDPFAGFSPLEMQEGARALEAHLGETWDPRRKGLPSKREALVMVACLMRRSAVQQEDAQAFQRYLRENPRGAMAALKLATPATVKVEDRGAEGWAVLIHNSLSSGNKLVGKPGYTRDEADRVADWIAEYGARCVHQANQQAILNEITRRLANLAKHKAQTKNLAEFTEGEAHALRSLGDWIELREKAKGK